MKTRPSLRSIPRALLPMLAVFLQVPAAQAAEGGLQLVPQWDLLGALLLFFLLLVFPVNALLFRPLLQTLDARADRIGGTRSRAEELDAQSHELRTRYESALREARDAAERTRRERVEAARGQSQSRSAEARAEAEQRIESARVELSTSLESARSQITQQAQELAQEAASRVLGRPL